ncbi:MAG: DUF6544 family protein [Bryobacteraceae bacterium]
MWTAAGLLLLLAAILGFAGQAWWRASAGRARRMLEEAAGKQAGSWSPHRNTRGLPLPVQRYLRRAVTAEAAFVKRVWMRQEGEFNLSEEGERWVPFMAEQRVTLDAPGFAWEARVRMAPAVPVFVRDAYMDGVGSTEARILGLWPVANVRGTGETAADQLMRFLAEAPWYPVALLPGAMVEWSAVDEHSARAKIRHGAVSAALKFVFGEDDFVLAVRSESRGRMVQGKRVPTPWQGRFSRYALRQGMWVPLEGEVSWILPSGPHPYWRGRVVEIRYE